MSREENCPNCGNILTEEGQTVRCPKCGLTAIKGGMILSQGRKRRRLLKCPECGTVATEDQYQEVDFGKDNPSVLALQKMEDIEA
jgi:ribosomal protein S27AE